MKKHLKKQSTDAEKEMSLSGHLRELRNRLIVCVILLLAAVMVGLYYAPAIVELLLDIGREHQYHFVYISPQELLMQYFSMALILGICVTFPVIIYQIWAFVRPGLRKNENLFFLLAIIFGLICFCGGVYFAYRIMLPFMLHFLSTLGSGSGIEAAISVQNYQSFLITLFLIFGMVFELPVVSVLLTQLGLIKVGWMKSGRKVVIVLIFILAAVITPPDVVSQVMVAIPILVLYELSIILCTIVRKISGKD